MGDSLLFIESWVIPMISIVIFYLIFGVVVLSLSGKLKLKYWTIFWSSVFSIFLINVLFWLLSGVSSFFLDLSMFSFLINFLICFFLPVLINKETQNKENLFFPYLVLFIIYFSFFAIFVFLVAVGIGRGFSSLG